MKLRIRAEIDYEAQTIYWYIREGRVAKTIEYSEEVFIDLDSDGRLLGVEMINPGSITIHLRKIAESYHTPALLRVKPRKLEGVFA